MQMYNHLHFPQNVFCLKLHFPQNVFRPKLHFPQNVGGFGYLYLYNLLIYNYL